MSPKRRKKPPRPKSQAAKQRARRARRAASKQGQPKVAKRTAKRGSRAERKAAKAPKVPKAAQPARKATSPTAKPASRRSAAKATGGAKVVTRIRHTGVRTPGRHAELNVVTTEPVKKPPKKIVAREPRPFAGAMENASAKDLAIFDLVRARVEVQAAIQGLQPDAAVRPVGEGKWSPREIVLHLHYWDREMLPWVERAWRHDERPPHTKDQILAENGSFLGELGHHDWDEARRLLQHSREQFLEVLQSVPEEPAEMWSSEHALGRLIRILSHHDRHHAAVLKDARSRAPANATESR